MCQMLFYRTFGNDAFGVEICLNMSIYFKVHSSVWSGLLQWWNSTPFTNLYTYTYTHTHTHTHYNVSLSTFVMVPTAFVRPSLNTSFWSQCRYSGVLMNRKWTVALSPVRRQSLFMVRMVAVCRMLPQCTDEMESRTSEPVVSVVVYLHEYSGLSFVSKWHKNSMFT